MGRICPMQTRTTTNICLNGYYCFNKNNKQHFFSFPLLTLFFRVLRYYYCYYYCYYYYYYYLLLLLLL